MVRVPSLILTIVFAPRRAIVWFAKVNSLRPSRAGADGITVVNAVAYRGSRRGVAWGGPSFTSFITCVTRVSVNCAAFKQVPARRRQISTQRPRIFVGALKKGEIVHRR